MVLCKYDIKDIKGVDITLYIIIMWEQIHKLIGHNFSDIQRIQESYKASNTEWRSIKILNYSDVILGIFFTL